MPVNVSPFVGHNLFGCIVLSLGIWWTIGILRRYFQQLSKNQYFYSTTWYPSKCCPNFPLEPYLKFFGMNLATCVSWYDFIHSLYLDDGLAGSSGSHAVATGMYVLIAGSELLQFYRVTVVGLFEDITFAIHILGVLGAVLTFSFHEHGRTIVDAHIHKILALTSQIGLIAVVLEYRYRNSLMVSLLKVYFYLMMGLWGICAAFMLDSRVESIPSLDLKKNDNVTLVTCLYVFLMIISLVFVCLTACFIGRPYKHLMYESQSNNLVTSTNGIANGGKIV